jgi:uncharacterized protein (TIGR03083 family)
VTTLESLAPDLVALLETRTADVVAALGALDEQALLAASSLPGWSRLTIACHLRFGAEALCRLTRGGLAGQPASYYPDGREQQRPRTLVPHEREGALDVLASLARQSDELHDAWRTLRSDDWSREVVEPEDQRDLGPLTLSRLPLLRLTEVEVHGSDLALGLSTWSDLFVAVALPNRLEWLNTRRSNHRPVDDSVQGSWLLSATDGPAYLVSLGAGRVDSRPASPTSPATAVIEAPSRDLLALLLGRQLRTAPRIFGDVAFGEAFTRAFPGP